MAMHNMCLTRRNRSCSLVLAEKRDQSLAHRNARCPSKFLMELSVGKAIPFPFGRTAAAIEDRRKLSFRPARIPFPQPTHSARHEVRHGHREEPPHILLVSPEELPA